MRNPPIPFGKEGLQGTPVSISDPRRASKPRHCRHSGDCPRHQRCAAPSPSDLAHPRWGRCLRLRRGKEGMFSMLLFPMMPSREKGWSPYDSPDCRFGHSIYLKQKLANFLGGISFSRKQKSPPQGEDFLFVAPRGVEPLLPG